MASGWLCIIMHRDFDYAQSVSTALSLTSPLDGRRLAPDFHEATAADVEGGVDLMWDALKGSSSNVVEARVQGTAAWTQAGIVQQSKFTVLGLTPGTLYEFRVHGVGKDGAGPFSDVAVKRAP